MRMCVSPNEISTEKHLAITKYFSFTHFPLNRTASTPSNNLNQILRLTKTENDEKCRRTDVDSITLTSMMVAVVHMTRLILCFFCLFSRHRNTVHAHRYNGFLPQGDRGRRRSKFVLYKRTESNGVERSKHYVVQSPQNSKAILDANQHSISYTLSRNQAIIVEYKEDSNTDMFQVSFHFAPMNFSHFTLSRCSLYFRTIFSMRTATRMRTPLANISIVSKLCCGEFHIFNLGRKRKYNI